MSFTNPPLQGKPPANALGLQSVQQIEREARSNQIVPSADIMVRRTTKGTMLSLRNKGTAGVIHHENLAAFKVRLVNERGVEGVCHRGHKYGRIVAGRALVTQ